MVYNSVQVKVPLNGLTILRFAHAFESGGGVEQHLADLNRELSKRNRLITIQMQLTYDNNRLDESQEKIGESVLVKVPLLVRRKRVIGPDGGLGRVVNLWEKAKHVALDLGLCTPALNSFAMQYFLPWRQVPRRPEEPEGVGAKTAEIIQRFKVNLVILHSSGGADASEIIEVAKAAQIPVIIVHHFSNDRLCGISLRQQVSRADGVAGASWVGVPAYLKKCFWNLSDAVDTEFFRREHARPLTKKISGVVLYAPGRVTPAKGQVDVLEVASILKDWGLKVNVVFAGRMDSPDFASHLRQLAIKRGLSDSVEFLGPLSFEEYRDWYCAAHVTVMPTRHNEGMPRTLIDSQAMKVPPIVYNVGGTKEGVENKETGFVVKLGDIEGMAKAVAMLIRHPEAHKRMAEAGRKFVEEKFSLEAFAKRHENFYTDVLKRAKN